MTLRTLQSRAEKNSHRVRHVVEIHPRVANVVTCGRIIENKTVTADEFSHQLVIRSVGRDLLLDPGLIDQAPVLACGEPQEIRPKLKVMSRVSSVVF